MCESWLFESLYQIDNYNINQNGENLNYKKNIEQKLNNTITLPFIFNNKKNTYSNFSYNKDGSKLAILIKNEERTNFELLLYIPSSYEVKYEQKLNNIITKYNFHDFLLIDERNILYKIFGNLSFLRLNQDTNNIYFLTNEQLLLTSLDRNIFIFIKLDEKNEYSDGFDKNSKNNNIIENINISNVKVKYLKDIIHEIKKKYIDLNLKLSFINKNIENLINNSIPKNIYIDFPSYLFGKNYYLLVDHNKLILIFYIENNTDQRQYILIFFLNYKYNTLEEDQKMTLEFPIGDIYKENNILSMISKIKNGYLVICLSFNDEHFQIVLIDMQLRIFKKYISKIFFIPTKRKGNITVITDLFIHEKYAFIIFDFYYIIIFDLINFDIIPILEIMNNNKNINNRREHYINIKKIFPKEYNKIIYLDFEKIIPKHKNKNNNFVNNNYAILYLITKKNIKAIKFNIIKSIKNSKNIRAIIEMFNKKHIYRINNVINNFNNKELYFYLNFYSVLQKFSKMNNMFYGNYLPQILYIIKEKILKNIFSNFKSKNGCIRNLLLLNQNYYFGIYNSFIRYNISTIKYLYFIENNDINHDYEETFNYLIIHKLIKNNENYKNINNYNINDYTLSLSTNYLITYQIISIIILLLLYEEKITINLINIYIKSNFIIKDNNDKKFILGKFKQILSYLNNDKTLNPFNNDKKIYNYNIKKKLIIEIRNNLININSQKNLILFESVFILIDSNFYKEKDIKKLLYSEIKFIKFIYFLISYYLNQIINEITFNKKNIFKIKIFNLYNINDILYSIDYLNYSFESIFKKFFIKEILLKIDNITQIKELFYILLSLKLINADDGNKNKILDYFHKNNNIDKNNFIVDPIVFILFLQNDKDYKNINPEIKDKINRLIQELIEKKINEDSPNNNLFKLIFLYYFMISNNVNYKESHYERKILIILLEKELYLFEIEILSMLKLLFKKNQNITNSYNPILLIKYKNNYENNTNLLFNLVKNKSNLIFYNTIMTNKFIYIFSIIYKIIDLFLLIFKEIKLEDIFNENNIIEFLLQKCENNKNVHEYDSKNDAKEKYYNKENIDKLFKTFCIYFWLFNSLIILIVEMNNKSLASLELSIENVLISLLHIYYFYNFKFPDESPILKKEIIQYINFINKKKINNNIFSIKMKNIFGIYFEKEMFNNFKEFFSEKNNIINIKPINYFQKKEKGKKELTDIYNYLKLSDIQFDIYLKQFKFLFLDQQNTILNCSNEYILTIKNNINKNRYIHIGNLFFNKYNKLLRYTKLLELINISMDNNIILNDILLSQDNFNQYNPQIIFSMRKSIEHLYDNKKPFDNMRKLDIINKYIDIVFKMNNNNTISEDNNTTIINNNTIYSFSNNNIEKQNYNSNINFIKKKEIDINFKDIKYNSDMANEIKDKYKNLDIKLYKSTNLEELMKRIKNKNNFYCCDYKEEEHKCKYLSLKLINKFILNKKDGLKFLAFKRIKALYYVNKKNKIDNQINIVVLNETEIEE